jgi:hypothetical protein
MAKKDTICKGDIPDKNINPVDFETRFGALVPWGGAMLGGASVRGDGTLVGDDSDDGKRDD